MPSEWLPALASPHDTASFISALHERQGDGPPLFSSLSANPDSGHISGGLDLRLPWEGSTVPALPQVAALGLQILLCWVSLRIHLGRPLPFLRICRGRSFMRSLFPMIRLWATVFLLFLLRLWAMLLIIWRYPASKGSLRSLLLFLWHLNFQRTVCRRGFPRPPLL